MGFKNPESKGFRYLVLALNCLLTFGAYFCFDQPSVVESVIQSELHISSEEYSLLYVVYAAANFLMVLFGGAITDSIGTVGSAFVFSSLVVAGVSLVAVGAGVRMLWLMVIGRFFFGAGTGSLTVAQNTISSLWFKGKELSMAFGFTLTASRLGSVLNFYTTGWLADHIGLVWTLWLGALLSVFSLLVVISYAGLERRAKAVGYDVGTGARAGSRRLDFKVVRQFPSSFWLLSSLCMLFYCLIFPFIAFAADFFEEKWHVSKEVAGPYAGICYTMSIFLGPLLGFMIDVVGRRAIIMTVASVLTLPAFLLLGLTYVSPIVAMVMLGFCYSLMAATVWPAVPLVIEPAAMGTAYGMMTALQMVGVLVWTYAMGLLKDVLGLRGYALLFLVDSGLTIVVAFWLLVHDRRRGCVIDEKGSTRLRMPGVKMPSFSRWRRSRRILADRRGGKEEVAITQDEQQGLLGGSAGQSPFESLD